MRNYLLSIMLLLGAQAFSQDTLIFTNGRKMPCTVTQIALGNITCHRSDSLGTRNVLIPKKQVRWIVYANGTVQVMSLKNLSPSELTEPMFLKGAEDASKHYTHSGGSIGTGITSFVTGGIFGLVPAIWCSSTTPRPINLGLPYAAPVKDKNYMLGYVSKAKKMKQKKVWMGYGIGVFGAIAFLLVTRH